MKRTPFVATIVGVALISATFELIAQQQTPPAGQQPPAGQAPAGRGEGRRGGGQRGPQPIAFEDKTGFQPIFDGTSLKGWDGDPTFWKAEGGAIVGESTEANPVKENTFIIWRGGEPADFELKVEFRINNTNSGVQYRSVHLPPGTPSGNDTVQGKWVLKGYQADIDFANTYTGMLYEERGRQIVALRGQVGLLADPQRGALGSTGTADELKQIIKVNDWNQFHVIARGSTLIHILNGRVTAILVDDDVKNRTMKGLLGFQIHQGPPMKVEFRNVLLKTL
jgi:Domain of Unknown Function (DUF1080)